MKRRVIQDSDDDGDGDDGDGENVESKRDDDDDDESNRHRHGDNDGDNDGGGGKGLTTKDGIDQEMKKPKASSAINLADKLKGRLHQKLQEKAVAVAIGKRTTTTNNNSTNKTEKDSDNKVKDGTPSKQKDDINSTMKIPKKDKSSSSSGGGSGSTSLLVGKSLGLTSNLTKGINSVAAAATSTGREEATPSSASHQPTVTQGGSSSAIPSSGGKPTSAPSNLPNVSGASFRNQQPHQRQHQAPGRVDRRWPQGGKNDTIIGSSQNYNNNVSRMNQVHPPPHPSQQGNPPWPVDTGANPSSRPQTPPPPQTPQSQGQSQTAPLPPPIPPTVVLSKEEQAVLMEKQRHDEQCHKVKVMIWKSLNELCDELSQLPNQPFAPPTSNRIPVHVHTSGGGKTNSNNNIGTMDGNTDPPSGNNNNNNNNPNDENNTNKGIDMSASFLKEYRAPRTPPPAVVAASSSTSSFATTPAISDGYPPNPSYDFFDLDDNGRIVVQPKVPMFPEDFPINGSIKPWPLSWWGIVDPELQQAEEVEGKEYEHDRDRDHEEVDVDKDYARDDTDGSNNSSSHGRNSRRSRSSIRHRSRSRSSSKSRSDDSDNDDTNYYGRTSPGRRRRGASSSSKSRKHRRDVDDGDGDDVDDYDHDHRDGSKGSVDDLPSRPKKREREEEKRSSSRASGRRSRDRGMGGPRPRYGEDEYFDRGTDWGPPRFGPPREGGYGEDYFGNEHRVTHPNLPPPPLHHRGGNNYPNASLPREMGVGRREDGPPPPHHPMNVRDGHPIRRTQMDHPPHPGDFRRLPPGSGPPRGGGGFGDGDFHRQNNPMGGPPPPHMRGNGPPSNSHGFRGGQPGGPQRPSQQSHVGIRGGDFPHHEDRPPFFRGDDRSSFPRPHPNLPPHGHRGPPPPSQHPHHLRDYDREHNRDYDWRPDRRIEEPRRPFRPAGGGGGGGGGDDRRPSGSREERGRNVGQSQSQPHHNEPSTHRPPRRGEQGNRDERRGSEDKPKR